MCYYAGKRIGGEEQEMNWPLSSVFLPVVELSAPNAQRSTQKSVAPRRRPVIA